jgi:hypothetical protein
LGLDHIRASGEFIRKLLEHFPRLLVTDQPTKEAIALRASAQFSRIHPAAPLGLEEGWVKVGPSP